MKSKFGKIIKQLFSDITLLNYYDKVEKLLFDNLLDKFEFYYMMLLYEKKYVSDAIFYNKEEAKKKLEKNNLFLSDYGKKCIEYWDYILNNEIVNEYKEKDPLMIKKNKNIGKIVFLIKPDFSLKKNNCDDFNERKGVDGEQQIYNELSTFYCNDYSNIIYGIYDVKLNKDFYSYQSDFILVSDYAIFIIEVKNWSGEIEIDEYGNFKCKDEYRKNPISQNNRHVDELNKFLIEKLDICIPIFPLTVFTRDAHIVKVDDKYKDKIINFDYINMFISNKISSMKKEKKYSAKVIASFINKEVNDEYRFVESYNLSLINEHHKFKKHEESEKSNHLYKICDIKKTVSLENYKNDIFLGICFNNDPIDKSFSISGPIKFDCKCELKYSGFFAVIYNFLISNKNIDCQDDVLIYIKEEYENEINVRGNYPKIYQLMITILLLIKNNKYIFENDEIVVSFAFAEKNKDILNIAFKCLNKYLENISLLSINKKINLKYMENNQLEIGYDNQCDIKISKSDKKNIQNELWIEDNIKYNFVAENAYILSELLSEISFNRFDNFKDGQLESIISVLDNSDNKIIIMPTGSGKSLIYYFSALLQPKSTIIISPTELLINNQIENLKKIYKINNASRLEKASYVKNYNMIFVTPNDLQNDLLIRELIEINRYDYIYAFVLDEVHCLSIKSHSFNPEYFTLSNKLNDFFKKNVFLGFTATAEFDVTKDLMLQLSVKEKNVISPIRIRNDRTKFEIKMFDSVEMLNSAFKEKCKLINIGKTLIFVKDGDIAKYVYDLCDKDVTLLYNQDNHNDEKCIEQFVEEQSDYKFLICPFELGIGLDFGDIKNILHYGLPYSKMDYIQQVGRAGRGGEYCVSYVLYVNPDKYEHFLFDRNINNFEFIEKINKNCDDNDYVVAYRNIFSKFLNYSIIKNEFKETLDGIFETIDKGYTTYLTGHFINTTSLFILLKAGLIEYWGEKNDEYVICISPNVNIILIKNSLRIYLKMIGESKMNNFITLCNNIKDLIMTFFDIFIDNYFDVKRNQFLNLIEMLKSYSKENNISANINDEFEKYFHLPFGHLINVEKVINELKLENINNLLLSGDIQLINASQYVEQLNIVSPKINYLKLINDLIVRHRADDYYNKIIQIANSLNEKDLYNLFFDYNLLLKKYVDISLLDDYLNTTIMAVSEYLNDVLFEKIVVEYLKTISNFDNKYITMALYFEKIYRK